MNWILIAYLFVLIYLVMHRDKFTNSAPLRSAWIAFALIPVSSFVFALFRAGNVTAPRDLALIEIWSTGVESLLLGISMLCLAGMIVPDQSWGSNQSGSTPKS